MGDKIIHKSWFGFIFIILCSGVLLAALMLGMYVAVLNRQESTFYIIGAFGILVLLGSGLQLYGYRLSTLTITATGITIINWYSLLVNQTAELNWTKVQDSSVKQNGFGTIFGYGTLLIQTAGTDKNFSFTYTPNPQSLIDLIEKQDAATPVLTHNV